MAPTPTSSLSISINPASSASSSIASPSRTLASSSSHQQPQQPLLITYHAPETLLHSPFAAHVLDSIRTQFPLSNLHFKPSLPPAITTLTPPASFTASAPGATAAGIGGAGVRTIPTLPVQLVELGKQQAKAQAEANAFIPPQSALDTPFLHLYLLVCDDVDHYRTILKADIQKWLQTIRTSPGLQTAHHKIRNGGLKNELLAKSGDERNGDSALPVPSKDEPAGAAAAAAAAASAMAAGAIGGGGTMEEVNPKDPEFLIVLISPSDSSVAAEVAASSSAASASSSSASGASGPEAVSPGGATTGKVGRFYSSLQKGSVLDKLRQDFNTPPVPGQSSSANMGAGRKDRIVHLTRLPPLTAPVFGAGGGGAGRYGGSQQHSVDPTMFADLVNRLKDYVLLELEHFVALQGRDLRVAESAKARLLASASASVPNGGVYGTHESVAGSAGLGLSAAYSMWDFCAWAAAKDFLARSLEGFNLLVEALNQYRDVDLEIQRSVQERSHPYFPRLGGLSATDDSSSVLDSSRKPYRDLLQRGDISLFDCRSYFFSRQAAVLSRIGGESIAKVMHDAVTFLTGLGRMLTMRQTMPRNYIEAWTYTNALLIVERAGIWLVEHGDVVPRPTTGSVEADLAAATARATSPAPTDGQVSLVFHMAKAELLALARRQLDKMGIAVGFLPQRLPFSVSVAEHPRTRNLPALPEGLKDDEGQQVTISNTELTKFLESKDIFDIQYVALVEREIAAWMTAGKSKNVILLRGILGSLNFARGRYEESYATFKSLPDAYGEEGWSLVEEDQLIMLLESHEKLGKPMDEQWAKSAVMLLRAKALGTQKLFSSPSLQSEWSSEERLWTELRNAAQNFAEQQPVTGYPGFIIRPLRRQVDQMQEEDGCKLAVSVESHVSIPFEVDDVRLCLTGAKRDQLWFYSGPITLNPGRSRLDLLCPSPPPGRFVIDVTQVRVANLVFQETFGKAALTNTGPGPSNEDKIAKVINIPEDGDALYATISLPQEVHLDRQRCAELSIESGRNHVETAEISVNLVDGTPLGGLPLSELLESQEQSLTLSVVEGHSRIQLHSIKPRTAAKILIPLQESAADGILRLAVTVDYITQERPEITRQFKRKIDLRIALPLGVNVQDFFREAALFSKFSISSGGISTLRIKKAELLGTVHGFKVDAPANAEATVVTPRQPALFVFKITRASSKGKPATDTGLRLNLSYRTLPEEARSLTQMILSRKLDGAALSIGQGRRNCLQRAIGRLIEDRLDVDRYAVTGEIWASDYNERAWQITCDRWGLDGDAEERTTILKVVRDTLSEIAGMDPGAALRAEELSWRSLSIPVDVPQMSIVNSVQLKLGAVRLPLIVGQPYNATIMIKTTFAWGPPTPPARPSLEEGGGMLQAPVNPRSSMYAESEADLDFEDAQSEVTDMPVSPSRSRASPPDPLEQAGERGEANASGEVSYALNFEVHGSYDAWLVSGDHHGHLPHNLAGLSAQTEDPPEQEFKINVIPLRHGSLLLPTVTVKAVATGLPAGGHASLDDPSLAPPACETFQANAAERVDVVPRRSRATYWVDLPTGAHWNAQGGARVIPA